MASSPRAVTKYVRNTRSPSRMNAFVPCHSSTPKSARRAHPRRWLATNSFMYARVGRGTMPKPLKAVLVTVLVLVLVTLSGSLAAPAVARDQDRCSHRTECAEGRWDRGNGPARPFRLVAPEPTGAYDVGRTTLHLVDADRRDPWRPNDLRE